MLAGARSGPDPAMPIAVAIAFAVHAGLIAAIGVAWPEASIRPSQPLELMVIAQPGTGLSATTPAVIAAQAEPPDAAASRLPELDPPTTAAATADPTRQLTMALPHPQGDPAPTSTAAPQPPQARPPQIATADTPSAEPDVKAAPGPVPRAAPSPTPPAETDPPVETASARGDPAVAASDQADGSESTEPQPISAADLFASRHAAIADLTARIQAQSDAYAKRTRRKAISTATREYIYANYLEGWRRKVERIGNLNYPQQARERGLFGSLILHVAVRADGSIEGVRVVRSSGHEVLDQAAIRIVELAAPFAPFPPNIKREVDVLDITRTWQFQRNHQLGWDN